VDTIGQGLNGGGRRRRRKHEPEFKARVVAACEQPGVSIASVALSNGLNANLVRRWLIAHEQGDGPGKAPEISSQGDVRLSDAPGFVALQLAPPEARLADIRIEVQRGPTKISVVWPTAVAADCATWLRELLK